MNIMLTTIEPKQSLAILIVYQYICFNIGQINVYYLRGEVVTEARIGSHNSLLTTHNNSMVCATISSG